MASSVFSQTLHSITTTKLNELSKKRKIFENQKVFLLLAAKNEPNQQKRVQTLVDGVKKCFSMRTVARRGDRRGNPGRIVNGDIKDPQLEVLVKNLEMFLQQAEYDPSISKTLLSDWERSLVVKLKVQSLKYEYASLYGELVTEWLNAEKDAGPADNMSVMSEDFEKIETTAKEASRTEWERLVFEPFETDAIEISNYLRSLFAENDANKQASRALDALRRSVKTFESSLRAPDQFNNDVLGWTINGLLASGLLDDEKRAVLKDFLASPVILSEVADVLNMRLAAISTWGWEQDVPIEQRRHVTGAYHVYIDEELLQAIFLQFIGIKWSVFFKEAFTKFFEFEGAWASLRQPISVEAKKRREYFLGTQQKKPSVQSKRQGIYRSTFFMSQLPDSPYTFQESAGVQGEEEARYDERPAKRQHLQSAQHNLKQQQMQQQMMMRAQQQQQAMMQQQQQPQAMMMQQQPMAQMPMQQAPRPPSMSVPYGATRYSNSDEYDLENECDKPKSSIAIKQSLLHLLSTELILNIKLHGDFTCTRSEFFSFSPTLPHSTISSVLSFFGLSDKWLSFFHKFLEAPLKFVEDGDDAPTRPRKRGVPGAHSLSAVCGEAILFCLDYAVNQQTNGAQLYRMHDDFWIWSPSHTTVVSAWSAITKFSDVMGVTLNAGKTGTVRIRRHQTLPAPIDESLPRGDIRWGFLYMDDLTGRFMIDQDMVDKHVLELQRQLESKNKSVFSWVQAWNTYAGTFFSTNFGKPANCFGREHVADILTTMNRVQKQIFRDSNIATYLKGTLKERFSIDDIPDGFLYFPASLGGLDLQNPFIPLLQVRNSVFADPSSIIDHFLDAEREAYRKAKEKFEKSQLNRNWNLHSDTFFPIDGQTFFSFEEFSRYREEFYTGYEGDLLNCFNDFLKQPRAETVDFGNEEWNEFDDAMGSASGEIDDYLKWVAQLYGKEMREKFGGLQIVEKGLLPMGMVGLFRSGRVKWQ
ncbi:uncharacterized protein PAC_13265 [Phialocephala subalpina]|uniref:Reverse transcriptase domain-containing protein n=1 Tax=Phialocephala subalpina TaxID=576137 RepID=A0A1L7XED0_9HELO|nr:uncharacterized protein PAC_13265 [Phialocephala subalpina]